MVRPDDGGGGGDYSSIKFAGMTALVGQVRSAGTTLQDTTKSLQSRASGCAVSCPAFAEIIAIGAWAEGQVDDLRRRLTLAQAAQSPIGTPLSEWTISEPVTMTTAEAEAKGRALAQRIKDHRSTDGQTADNIHEAALQLGIYAQDPDVLSAFFAEMGDQTAMLPELMEASGSDTATEDLQALSVAFGNAMKDPEPPQAFTDLKHSFTQPLDKEYTAAAWARLAFLQYGEFPPRFAADVVRASGLVSLSKDGYDIDYRGGFGNRIGLSEDNVALMFGALKDNPEAARLAFDGLDLKKITQTAYGAARSLGTGDDIATAFAEAMEAATGTNDEYRGHHSKDAAEFTLRFIQASGSVKNVPDDVKEALGLIAASWAPELVAGSNVEDAGSRASGMGKPAGFDEIPGLDPMFFLAPGDVYRFVHGFASDDRYSEPFDESVGALYHDALVKAARIKAEDPESAAWDKTQRVFGELAGFEYAAQEDVRGDMDQHDAEMRALAGKVLTLGLGKVPTPQGVALAYGWKIASFAIKKGISTWVKGNPEETRVALLEDQELQSAFLVHYQLSQVLSEAHYPGMDKAPAILLEDGHLKAPDVIAKDAGLIAAYEKWSDATDHDSVADIDNLLDGGKTAFRGGQGTGEDEATKYGW